MFTFTSVYFFLIELEFGNHNLKGDPLNVKNIFMLLFIP